MSTVLVTGGTGKLGRAVVERLTNGEREIRVLSRTPGTGRTVGDLRTGAGLEEAVEGVDVVVHCATTYGRDDVVAARRCDRPYRGHATSGEYLDCRCGPNPGALLPRQTRGGGGDLR
ncbi:SDR family oxidoreductase [Nocardia jiangxiensis]|uniref:SDR family oxidoreductase n=1 Tax=Nocardia jiangxiensis TaxID=282685 RepID=A0ABW6SBQ6_9NOCA